MGYPAKVQLISRPANQQWYVNFPNAVAQAIGLRKGETVEWEIESRGILVMVRKNAPPARKLKKLRPVELANVRG
jgi:antitoxin component of MazEF toxin-antitoxin module